MAANSGAICTECDGRKSVTPNFVFAPELFLAGMAYLLAWRRDEMLSSSSPFYLWFILISLQLIPRHDIYASSKQSLCFTFQSWYHEKYFSMLVKTQQSNLCLSCFCSWCSTGMLLSSAEQGANQTTNQSNITCYGFTTRDYFLSMATSPACCSSLLRALQV